MIKLSKEKRDMLIGIFVGAVALSAALLYFVAAAQKQQMAAIQVKTQKILAQITQGDTVRKTAGDVAEALRAQKAELEKRESGLVDNRDPYSWMVQTMGPFILPRKNVNIPVVSPPVVGADTMVSRSPYKTATFKCKGLGYYHDFGKFFADFENSFPYFRVQNWEMSPAGGGSGSEGEKLNVSFDIVAPVKAPPPEPAK